MPHGPLAAAGPAVAAVATAAGAPASRGSVSSKAASLVRIESSGRSRDCCQSAAARAVRGRMRRKPYRPRTGFSPTGRVTYRASAPIGSQAGSTIGGVSSAAWRSADSADRRAAISKTYSSNHESFIV